MDEIRLVRGVTEAKSLDLAYLTTANYSIGSIPLTYLYAAAA